jgi:uncharacterized membrane protein
MANPQDELEALRAQVAGLTARVFQLEEKAGLAQKTSPPLVPKIPPPSVASTPAPGPVTASPPTAPAWRGTILAPPQKEQASLETRIGQQWFNRIGIVAILIGVSFFLKYAFENNWIGPGGRIAIGLLSGMAVIVWSERFRAKGHLPFSYSLKAVGIGTLYLSLWGAFHLYALIPSSVAFAAMIVVTAATITLALTQNAQLLASFALIGGFITPVLLSTGENHEIALFAYVGLLDLAILAMAVVKPWRRLLWGSFWGTIILYVGWYAEYYSASQRPATVFFAALFAGIFAAVPLVSPYKKSTRLPGPSITLTALPLLNAGIFFLELWVLFEDQTATLAWLALVIAAVYLGISNLFVRRFSETDKPRVIAFLHIAIAIAFITIAIPLKLNTHWITIGWLIESAALLWVAVRTRVAFLRYLATATLVLGVLRLLVLDNFLTQTLIFNSRFVSYLIAVAIMGGIVYWGKSPGAEEENRFVRIAGIALNLLALVALTLEASDFFSRQMAAQRVIETNTYRQFQLAQDFSYSAIWLVYGAVLMVLGFRRRSEFLRWQALVLMAVTILKVFIYDVHQLESVYRVLSFIALGVILMGISFIYQRDLLKLSPRSAGKPSEEGSA